MNARKYESKMISMRNEATEKLFSDTRADIEKKVKRVDDFVMQSSLLAKEISKETNQMQ